MKAKYYARLKIAPVLCVLLSYIFHAMVYAAEENGVIVKDKAALAVTVTTPIDETWDINVSASGVISPWQEAVVAAEIAGLRITEVLVDVGSEVQRGQPLIKLSTASIEADVAHAEAMVEQSKAGVAQAKSGIAQAEASTAQAMAGVTQAEAGIAQAAAVVEQAQAGVQQAQAGVEQANAGVAQAGANVSQSEANVAQAGATLNQAQANVAQAGAALGQVNAAIVRANAAFAEAQANANRARQLRASGTIPLQQVDQYLTAEATARASVDEQKAALTAQKAAFNAQKAGLEAQKSGVNAKKAEMKAQLSAVHSRQAEVKAQQAAVSAQQAVLKGQQAALKARYADVAGQKAAVNTQQAGIEVQLANLVAQEAALKVQQASLQSQKIRLEQTVISAADEGVVSARSAALGMVVQAGTELFRIIRQNRLEWHAEVPSNELGQIREGQSVTITLTTGEVIEGEVRLITPTLDANTRNALVYVSLPLGSSARAGMFVQGAIRSGATNALTLPQSAVILRDGKNYIFELDKDKGDKVLQHQVKVGRRLANKVEILSELKPEAQVVVTGGAFLNDGDTVKVVDALEAKP